MVTISAADVDQLAEKNDREDPQAAANHGNLYVTLGANDYLDAATGLTGTPVYGYWLDAAGTAYDRQYTGSVGADTVQLYVRGGDDAPDFASKPRTAGFDTNRVTLTFAEPATSVGVLSLSEFFGAGVNSVTGASVATGDERTTLTLIGSFDTAHSLKLAYGGTQITGNLPGMSLSSLIDHRVVLI